MVKWFKMVSGFWIASRKENELDKKKILEWCRMNEIESKINFLGHHSFEHLSSTEIKNKGQ